MSPHLLAIIRRAYRTDAHATEEDLVKLSREESSLVWSLLAQDLRDNREPRLPKGVIKANLKTHPH